VSVPEILGASFEIATAGFHVSEPLVNRRLDAGAHLLANRRRAILRVDDVGTFAIADGTRIRFEPERHVSDAAVSVWLHGTAAALLLAQRGRFALHASVVDVGGVGLAVAGQRRAGKSTTVLRLAQSGHTLVTDDVSPIDSRAPVTVHPFDRPLHVLPRTATALGVDIVGARPIAADHPKLALPVSATGPIELAAIAVLRPLPHARTVDAVKVRGAEAHRLVAANIYRRYLMAELRHNDMFACAATIAERVPVYLVTRPAEEWTVDTVAHTAECLVTDASGV
jgi:hypothetical protein